MVGISDPDEPLSVLEKTQDNKRYAAMIVGAANLIYFLRR